MTELHHGSRTGRAATEHARPTLGSTQRCRETLTTGEPALLAASPFACGTLLTVQGRLDATAARRLLDLAQATQSPSQRRSSWT